MSDHDDRFPAGWTTRIGYALKKAATASTDPAAFDATGMTLALILRDRDGVIVTHAGTVAWIAAATSQAGYTPASGDLTVERSPLTARWKVTDGGGAVAYFPKDHPVTWYVDEP